MLTAETIHNSQNTNRKNSFEKFRNYNYVTAELYTTAANAYIFSEITAMYNKKMLTALGGS